MKRFPDWLDKLHTFVENRRTVPFTWGSNDCCLFVADAITEMTGIDPAADLRGYKTEIAARKILKKAGGMQALFTARFGEPVGVLAARRGDVVLATAEDGTDAVGICLGGAIVFAGPNGAMQLPLTSGRIAWRID